MDAETLKIVAQVAGIGGVALGVFLLLFREVIRKQIFPEMTKKQSFVVIIMFLTFVWSIAIAGMVAWVWTSNGGGGQISTISQDRIYWEKNWQTISESRGFLGSSGDPEDGGGSWTNKEETLAMLNALNLAKNSKLAEKRKKLILLVKNGMPHPKGETYYNLSYTSDIRLLEESLRRDIRSKALEHGVKVVDPAQ